MKKPSPRLKWAAALGLLFAATTATAANSPPGCPTDDMFYSLEVLQVSSVRAAGGAWNLWKGAHPSAYCVIVTTQGAVIPLAFGAVQTTVFLSIKFIPRGER